MFAELAADIGSAPEPVGHDEYRLRQSRLLEQLDAGDLLIICSRPPAVRTNDVEHPYRNNSDMMYLCGWNDKDSVLIAQHTGDAWSVELFVQPRDVLMEIWNGRRPGTEGAVEGWPIDAAHSMDDLETVLEDLLAKCSKVYLRSKFNSDVDAQVDSAMSRRDRDRQQHGIGLVAIVDPSNLIAELRLTKSPAEIAQMRHACEISSIAHVAAMKHAKPNIGEWQLEAILEGFFRFAGASGIAYPSIVGCGDNATILHYNSNQMSCGDGEVVLIDAGGEYRGYAADITRSWPINGKFSPAQREIYELVLKAQLAAIEECRVGNPYDAPHKTACKVLAQGLIDLGIIKTSLKEAIASEGELRKWYMHNTGHWIGMDVHDVGIYRLDSEPRIFAAGMVITVEPGLYFGAWRPDVEIDDKWAGIGIRIEDDVLITEGDPDVLSSFCPKNPDELESIIGNT